jgi:hypothetical protein
MDKTLIDMKEELNSMLAEVKSYLKAKETEVAENPNCNSYAHGELLNRKRDVANFEIFIKQANEPTLKSEIIKGFRKDADRIKADIDKIKCEPTGKS